ncbi:MAG: RNA methyltransferase [Acidobacteria bacterium]|nr:RNA methyltransferase [Acidobacteriota bacterium]
MSDRQRDQGPPSLAGIPTVGRSSPLVRDVRALAGDAALRRSRRLAVAEGIHLAQEALRRPAAIRHALVSPRLLRSEEGQRLPRALAVAGVDTRAIDDPLLASLSRVESHQGVLLLVERPEWAEEHLIGPAPPPRVLVACAVQDPGNLGALARVTEAASGTGFVCAGGADPFSPRALRASAGSLLRLPVVESASPSDAVASCRRLGLRLVGTSPRARTGYRDAELGGALALFVGSEGPGLDAELSRRLDLEVSIPMKPGVESLNVATAAAVILFEAVARK